MLERTCKIESLYSDLYKFKVTFLEKFNAKRYCVIKEAFFMNYIDAIKAAQEWEYNK